MTPEIDPRETLARAWLSSIWTPPLSAGPKATVVISDLLLLVGELRGQQLQWQPIATAPKDGTQVWLWWDSKCRLAHWHEAIDPPSIGGRFANWLTDDKGAVLIVTKPTHWMPLPTSPREAGA